MKDTRLIEILKTFTTEEIKSFDKFLDSNFVKSRRNLKPLYNYLVKFHPGYESEKLSKEIVFGKIYGKEKFNEKKLNNHFYDLTKAAESFLLHSVIEDNPVESMMNLGRALYNKKLFVHALRQVNSIGKIIKPDLSMERDIFNNVRKLEALKIDIYSEQGKFPKAIESRHRFDEAIVIQFMIDFIWMMGEQSHLQYNAFRSDEEDIFASVKDSIDIDKFISSVYNSGIINEIVVSFYYHIYKLHSEPDNIDNYFKLKEILTKNINQLEHYEKFIVLFYMSKFINNYHNRGNESISELLDLYILILDHNAYAPSPGEYLEPTIFRNLLHFSPIRKDDKFIKSLIDQHVRKHNPEIIDDIERYSNAFLNFFRKDYEKSLESLSKIKNIHRVFVIDSRVLKLKLFYELNYIEEAISAIDALNHYLSKNKETPEALKEQVRMFSKVYAMLINLKAGTKKNDAGFVKKQLENPKLIYNRKWLGEKMVELVE